MAKWLSKKQVDRLGNSFYYSGIHSFLKKTGEAPVILDQKSTDRSLSRLQSYYFDKGYFNLKGEYKIDSISNKKAFVKYNLTKGKPFILDTININIKTPVLDSLYKTNKELAFLKSGKQYNKFDFDAERNRITAHFRNNGAYYFQQNYINYSIDTLNANSKANIDLNIEICNNIEYRSYQYDAFNSLKGLNRAILAIPCGMGKTYIGYLLSKEYKNVAFPPVTSTVIVALSLKANVSVVLITVPGNDAVTIACVTADLHPVAVLVTTTE